MTRPRRTTRATVILALALAACDSIADPAPTAPATPRLDVSAATTDTWPGLFDPFTVLSLRLTMAPGDWDVIRKDLTNTIEVPAQLHTDGETPTAVTVRRKSSRALPSEGNPIKVGLKVKTVSGRWHGVTTLSLENGADSGPVQEGVAWNLYELASADGFAGADYHAGLASWVRVYVNNQFIGVFVNAEQRNKQFLRNRHGTTDGMWLYEVDEVGVYLLEAGDPHSPTYTALCFSPFRVTNVRKGSGACPVPADATLETTLNTYIDMRAMLVIAALDAFTDNPDALFTHGKNYFAVDSLPGGTHRRAYYPWDLDAVFRSATANIYASGSARKLTQTVFQSVILNHPTFRNEYNEIMLGLVDPAGPLGEATLHAWLDAAKAAVQPALNEDPYLMAEFKTGQFDFLKSWISQRIASVRTQVERNNNPPPRN